MSNPNRARRRFTPQQKEEAVALCLAEGLTCTAVAQRLGIPVSSLAKWVRDPEMTLVPSKSTDPIAADAPKADLRNRFPAKVVQNLHRYYGTLAEEEVASSASKAAGDWRALRAARDASMFSPTQVREQVREARGYANGLMTAP